MPTFIIVNYVDERSLKLFLHFVESNEISIYGVGREEHHTV